MDAGASCVGVAPHSALLSSQSFADAAIARALHFSLSADNAAPEPPPSVPGAAAGDYFPVAAPLPSPSSSARCRLGPAGGHAGKRRRPRPSKRAPTTYIRTDAATFRVMVQRVTGADEADLQQQDAAAAAAGLGLGLGLVLPHLGVEQFLPAAYATIAPTMAAPAAEQQQQQQPPPPPPPPLFPTLDSWNVMYGGTKNEVV